MKWFKIILSCIFVLLAAGCGQEEPTPEPTLTANSISAPDPTATDSPSSETPEPTEMPQPTNTPVPTATPIPAESLIEMGDIQLLQSDWSGAEESYRQAIEIEPENALALARMSYLLHFHPQTQQQALEVGRTAVELAPNDPVVGAFLILALKQVGQYEEALEQAERIDAYAFNNTFARSVLADLYLAIGDYVEADNFIGNSFSVSDPASGIERVEIDRIHATYAYLNNNQPLIIQNINHLGEISPNFAPAYLVRSQLLPTGGLRGLTQRVLVAQGLALDADYLPLMVQLAHLDAQSGNFGLAMDSCEEVIQLFPDLSDGPLCQGNVFLQQGMYLEAEEAFSHVLDQNEENYRGYLGLGKAYLGLEECETAEAELVTALEHQPYAVETYIALAQSYGCLDDTEHAESAFEQALSLHPYNPATYFELGNYYFSRFLYDDAGPEYIRAITYAPPSNTPPAYYANLGRTIQAVERCTVSGSTQDATRYLCAGQFLLGIEYYLSAAETFNLALKIDENSFYALEGLVAAYANERYCDVALSFLVRLSTIVTPRTSLIGIFNNNCENAFSGTTSEPAGESISEDEALQRIETAVFEQVQTIDELTTYFDTFDPEIAGISEQRILIIEFSTSLEQDSAELERLLNDTVFAATEGFVLTGSQPRFMLVQAKVGSDEVPTGYFVPRFSASAWYDGDFTTKLYLQTWSSVGNIFGSVEDEAETETNEQTEAG